MSSLSLLILLLSIIALSTAFDKNLLKKAKFDVSHKHPISRRVLRFERSVDQFDNNRIDEELGLPFDFPSFDTHAVESKDTSSTNQFVSQKDLFTLLTPFNEQDVEETNF
ncbi:hypothetical protein PRIPAC_87484 [Pristionchus pacificus]|uniref:Uncharacterized protein n=1 Tax=Pristionchus pacificus TaxID=54126 RepID=A0A2A6CJC5_PRIPA|nr:hypothetical protein PRIPAC_87484 [Pristionchus pacificus]|eukprot:PDM78143.1 hypothetical protein PRIPAC_30528 [Pristionchus pacificus]